MTTINITGEKITIKNPIIREKAQEAALVVPAFTKTVKASDGDKVQIKFPLDAIPIIRAIFTEDVTYKDGSRSIANYDRFARININLATEPPDMVHLDFGNAQLIDWNTLESSIENNLVTYTFTVCSEQDTTNKGVVDLYGTDSVEFKLV